MRFRQREVQVHDLALFEILAKWRQYEDVGFIRHGKPEAAQAMLAPTRDAGVQRNAQETAIQSGR